MRPLGYRPGRILKRLVSRFLFDHVAVGRLSSREVEDYFWLPRNSVRTIYNGVEELHVDPYDFGSGQTVGTVARLSEQKGLDRLINSMAHIDDVRLVIVGDGDLRANLQKLVLDLGMQKRVVFTGWQENPRSFIAGFDVFVLPSRNEAFPLSIVEAMLSGTPVIASDVGSVSEAVKDGITGFLIREERLETLSVRIREVLDGKHDIMAMTTEARKLAMSKYTRQEMARQYAEMWNQPRGRVLLRCKMFPKAL